MVDLSEGTGQNGWPQATPGLPPNGDIQQQIERTLSYVARVARRYFGCGVEPDELRTRIRAALPDSTG